MSRDLSTNAQDHGNDMGTNNIAAASADPLSLEESAAVKTTRKTKKTETTE